MRILIIEDDLELAQVYKEILEHDGFSVDTASSGEEGERLFDSTHYDAITLDLSLPGKDGFAVCRSLRTRNVETPILMITGRYLDSNDEVKGLKMGADDYLRKPFTGNVLCMRIRALLRRSQQLIGPKIQAGEMVLDPVNRQVICGQSKIDLTSKENSLLEYLMRHPGLNISRERIMTQAWREPAGYDSNVVDVYIKRLRQKLAKFGLNNMIQTVPSAGYRFIKDT